MKTLSLTVCFFAVAFVSTPSAFSQNRGGEVKEVAIDSLFEPGKL